MTSLAPARPKIAVTLGDPAGIGPELAVKTPARPGVLATAEVFILADAAELAAAEQQAGMKLPLASTATPGYAVLLDDQSAPAEPVPAKQVSAAAGQRAMHQLQRALTLAMEGQIDAIVFAPLRTNRA